MLPEEIRALFKALLLGTFAVTLGGAFRDMLESVIVNSLPTTERKLNTPVQILIFRVVYFLFILGILIVIAVLFVNNDPFRLIPRSTRKDSNHKAKTTDDHDDST